MDRELQLNRPGDPVDEDEQRVQSVERRRGRPLVRGSARGEVPICGWCGEPGHTAIRCRNRDDGDQALLERKSGNGEYTGPLEVRVIPPGVTGAQLAGEEPMGAASLSRWRGHEKQKRQAAAERAGRKAMQRKVERARSAEGGGS